MFVILVVLVVSISYICILKVAAIHNYELTEHKRIISAAIRVATL